MNANVPIRTFADILAAMERQPELEDAMRRHVLSQEILRTPHRPPRAQHYQPPPRVIAARNEH